MTEPQRFVKHFGAPTMAELEKSINAWVTQHKNVVIVHTSLAMPSMTQTDWNFALVTYYLQD